MKAFDHKALLGPALVSAALFGLLVLALALAHGGHVSALMMLPQEGHCYQTLGAPQGIAVFPQVGYDGHLFYYIARDLGMAEGCAGAYRYQRILYPVLVWLLSLGSEGLMPLMMSLINVLSIGLGTWLMARWLAELGRSPWLALVYGLSMGHVIIVQYALAGALASTLALAGAYLAVQRQRLVWAAIFFSLALLTRETVVLLWAPLILWSAWQRKWPAAMWLSLALVPYLAWEAVLWARFGQSPLFGTNAEAVTFNLEGLRWLFSHLDFSSGWAEALRQASSLPYLAFVLICLAAGGLGLIRGHGLWAWVVLFQAAVCLVLGRGMWAYVTSIGRISVTLVPACLFLSLIAGKWTRRLLIGSLAGLFLLALARVYLAGVHRFFIQT
ncbi:MAG: hypothetical protein JRJ59_06455 [Deltaproteobacteria bacterium]|nr:hypothetical protein [Deltaproteobacteria bacterium]